MPPPVDLHTTDTAVARTEERLSLGVILAFGAPSFAGAAMAIPIGVLMPIFYTDVVGAPLGYVAMAIALARSFDALTDPVMGWITDRTRTRWGRRKPYIALGVPLAAVCIYALFSPPQNLGPLQASLWFLAAFGLYFLFHTVYEIPHGALGVELTLDYHERTRLFGIRTFFIGGGTLGVLAFLGTLRASLETQDERAVFTSVALTVGTMLVLLYFVLLWVVPERPEFALRKSNPLVPGVRRSLRNRPFRIIFFSGIINAIPAAIPAVMLPYLVKYVIRPPNPEAWIAIGLAIYLGTGMLCLPLHMWLARRIGKLNTLILNAIIGISGTVLFFFADEGDTGFLSFVMFVVGIQSNAGMFLIPAMVADSIDYDELLTGRRREAQFGSFLGLLPKFFSIPGQAVPLAVLASVGFVPNQEQTPQVILCIKVIFAVFPPAFYIAALTVMMRYPISEKVHLAIREGIAAHARGEDAMDPIRGGAVPPHHGRGVDEDAGWLLDYFSAGELKRHLSGGASRLVLSSSLCAAGCLALSVAAAWYALSSFSGLDTPPGATTVVTVVIAGFSLTAFLFHAVRAVKARSFAHDPLPDREIRRHLGMED
jgi:GPH family glycoside/pentoside/hexuronide:cation symporter